MAITFTLDERYPTLFISGRFDFTCSQEFELAYRRLENPAQTEFKAIIVDFRHTESIDSSGIGLLLRMQHDLHCAPHSIHIINCKNSLYQQFEVAQFERFFSFAPPAT